MLMQPYYLIECIDEEEALELLALSPLGSHTEVCENGLVILWVPVPDDVIEAELERSDHADSEA